MQHYLNIRSLKLFGQAVIIRVRASDRRELILIVNVVGELLHDLTEQRGAVGLGLCERVVHRLPDRLREGLPPHGLKVPALEQRTQRWQRWQGVRRDVGHGSLLHQGEGVHRGLEQGRGCGDGVLERVQLDNVGDDGGGGRAVVLDGALVAAVVVAGADDCQRGRAEQEEVGQYSTLQRQFMSPQKVEHAGSNNCSRSVLIFCCSIVGPCPWAGRGPVNWRRRLS